MTDAPSPPPRRSLPPDGPRSRRPTGDVEDDRPTGETPRVVDAPAVEEGSAATGVETPQVSTRATTAHPARRWVVLLASFLAFMLAATAAVWQIAVRQGWSLPAGPSTVPASVFVTPSEPPSEPGTPPPDPSPTCVAAALDAVPAQGVTGLTGQVIGLRSGAVLWSRASDRLAIPASNQKLLTALAVAEAAPDGLATVFKTSVVAGPGNQIVLVGGGDPYLASSIETARLGQQQATLDELAAQAAEVLKARGQRSVRVGFDASLFTGPDWHSTWRPSYHTDVTAVSALWVDQGMTPTTPGGPPAARSATPALDAARYFASRLQGFGVTVTGVAAARAPAGASALTSVDSLPLRDIIAQTLLVSDNSAAEVLLRHLSRFTGGPGSFADGARALTAWLKAHQLLAPGQVVVDGSGLSRSNLVPAATLAHAVVQAAASDGASREILAGLPVSAATGTLLGRFQDRHVAGGRGWVHAKTGALVGVATMTGYTVTTSGQLLAFSLMINDNTKSLAAMRAWLDRLGAALTTAQC